MNGKVKTLQLIEGWGLFVLLLLFQLSSRAQGPFFIYHTGYPIGYGLFELSSGNYFTTLVNTPSNGSGASLMNTEGELMYQWFQSHMYNVETTMPHWRFSRRTDSDFFFACPYWLDTCVAHQGPAASYPAIGRVDSLGVISEFYYYDIPSSGCWNVWMDLIATSDGSAIAWGSGAGSFFALRRSFSGEVDWARRFPRNGGIGVIRELPCGDLLVGLNLDTAGASVARLDSQGDMLWCKSYFRASGMVQDILVESDTTFVVVGLTDSIGVDIGVHEYPEGYDPPLYLMKLNATGGVIWCKGFQEQGVWYSNRRGARVVRTFDSEYAVLANIGYPGYGAVRTFLIKLDQNGDTLWTRSPGLAEYQHHGLDLLACADSGFMIQGYVSVPTTTPLNGASSFVCKTDQVGRSPCFETTPELEVFDIYPLDSSFTIGSINGATMRPTLLRTGVPGLNTSFDACLYPFDAIPDQALGRFSLFPNPTAGLLSLEFAQPLSTRGLCSVYDWTGKVVLQSGLPAHSTSGRLDLSAFGAGVYSISIYAGGKYYREQVVVE